MTRYAHAIFCDDIRHEQGGKVTLVGVYSGALLVPALPAVLPKLCLVLSVFTPASQPFKALRFRVFRNTDILAEGEISAESMRSREQNIVGGLEIDAANHLHSAIAHFVFSPFNLDEPEVIRVRVETESETLKVNGLVIAQMPPLGAESIALGER